jgi:pimeloyl-ACP methyl ester carboxylesterase
MNWKKHIIGEWSWKRPFISLAWIYVILAIIAFFFGEKLLFRPHPCEYANDGIRYKLIENGATPAIGYSWVAPPDDVSPVIIYFHGNAEDIADNAWLYDECNQRGYGIFALDYPSYGISAGVASEDSVNRASATAYDFLQKELGIASKRIVIIGRSVGCGPALKLARKQQHAGVILISPFTSAFKSVTRIPIFFGDMFPNDHVITQLHTPLLIMHGENDSVIPSNQGKALFDRCPSNKKTWAELPGCGHNDIFDLQYEALFRKIDIFMSQEIRQSLTVLSP